MRSPRPPIHLQNPSRHARSLDADSTLAARLDIQIGSYHYVSGVEASSSASLAAYLNSLQFELEESGAWFSKGPSWKVRSGTYWSVSHVCVFPRHAWLTIVVFFNSCFNAFSRVDVRVDVKIPGGVDGESSCK